MKPIRLLSSDLDGTLAGDPAGTAAFARHWAELRPEQRPLLVYNSGRLIDDMLAFTAAEGLPEADFLIGGVGTMVHGKTRPDLAQTYEAALGAGFDLDLVDVDLAMVGGLVRQPARYQHAMKSSWFLHNASAGRIGELEQMLRDAGHRIRIVYSSARDLDVIPELADKGQALAWLCATLGVALDEVVVAGDTGNDRAMFELAAVRGILPANALSELASLAQGSSSIVKTRGHSAHGVVEGLRHFGVFPAGPEDSTPA